MSDADLKLDSQKQEDFLMVKVSGTVGQNDENVRRTDKAQIVDIAGAEVGIEPTRVCGPPGIERTTPSFLTS